jgi:uncharacterized RDD family membrane protein YckC
MSSADKLTIETPEQTSLEFPLAGVGSRFLAMLADTALQTVAAAAVVLVTSLLVPAFRWMRLFGAIGKWGPQWALGALVLAFFLINSGYFAFFESIWNGQTPGKRYTDIRVIKDDGRPITVYDAIARNLLRIVDELPGLYGIGVISILLSKQGKRLGDYVAGTVVVHEKAIEAARPFLDSPPANNDSAEIYDVSSITLDELYLMETFFQRRDSFDPALRTSIAAQIASKMAQKLNVRVVGWPQTERFLEAVYAQCRATGRSRV